MKNENEPEVGQTGELRHERFGRATVKVLAIVDEWMDIELLKGQLRGMGAGSIVNPGESRRVRRSHCHWYAKERIRQKAAGVVLGILAAVFLAGGCVTPGGPGDVGTVKIRKIWTGPSDTWKLVGMKGTKEGIVATTANVYRGRHLSRIFVLDPQGKVRVQKHDFLETIGQPTEAGGILFFPVEHGSHVLTLDGLEFGKAAKTAGRWSTVGIDRAIAFNDQYTGGRVFKDHPVFIDGSTGKKVFTLPVAAMPRDANHFLGDVWITHNFGRDGVSRLKDPKTWDTDVVFIEPFRGLLYGGGGAAWGRNAKPETANGRIYVLKGDEWKEVFDSGSSSIQAMKVFDGRLWIAGIDPDRLIVVDAQGKIGIVAELAGETSADGARSFGAGLAVHGGKLYWGRSTKHRPEVWAVE